MQVNKRSDDDGAQATDATRVAGEPFLQRFSRRKHEARQAAETPDPPAPAESTSRQGAELTDADMPALESLDESSDYSIFLSAKVSEPLRRDALRKLFHSSTFNVIDELDDYAEDFTRFQTLGDIVTAEMRHRLEVEARRQMEALTAADDDDNGTPPVDGPLDASSTQAAIPTATQTDGPSAGAATTAAEKPSTDDTRGSDDGQRRSDA